MNRPSVSFSHAGSGMTRGPVIGNGLWAGAPISKCCRGGSNTGRAARCLLRQRDTAPQDGLEPAELLENLECAPKDPPARCGRPRHRRHHGPQLGREGGINLRKSQWGNDLATRCEQRVSLDVPEPRKSAYPLGLREKRKHSVKLWASRVTGFRGVALPRLACPGVVQPPR